jgi:nucleotide-binding universal stress UspA family protein
MNNVKRILVPLDGSPLAEQALPPAITLAKKFNSEIFLVRAVDFPQPLTPSPMPEVAPSMAMLEAREQAKAEAEHYLDHCRDEMAQQGIHVTTRLYDDTSPAEDIIDAAESENIDVIVMSTHGRGGIARWAFGSVADKVVRHGSCPVLLVRQTEPEAVAA